MASLPSDPSQSLLPLTRFIGVRFCPTDHHLLHYLRHKIDGHSYPGYVFFDYDLYGSEEPWTIWESFGGVDGEDLYFFTQLKRSTNKSGGLSAHVNRKIGSTGGTWSGENKANPIFTDGNILGYSKRFRYENKSAPKHNGEWIMHEYSLYENWISNDVDANSNFILCRIRKNERPKRKAEQKRCMQHIGKKRIMADDPMMSQMRKNEKEMCHYELQPTEQRDTLEMVTTQSKSDIPVYTSEMVTYQGRSDIPTYTPEMITNSSTNDMPTYTREVITNQDTSDVPTYTLEMITGQNTNDMHAQDTNISSYTPEIITNQDTSDVPTHTLEMIIGQDTNDIPAQDTNISSDTFEMTTNQDTSDVLYDTTLNQDSNNVSYVITNEESTIDKEWWFNFLDRENIQFDLE